MLIIARIIFEGPTHDVNGIVGTAEKKFSIKNFL